MAAVAYRQADYRQISGAELIRRYQAPLLGEPPPYAYAFCERCACVVPDPDSDAELGEVAAGLLDDDPGARPDKHIFVEHRAPWHEITDALPQMDRATLVAWRNKQRPS